LTIHVRVRLEAGDDGGSAEALEARRAAAEVKDYWAYNHATFWGANCLDCPSSTAYGDYLRAAREELIALGAPHTYVAQLSAVETSGLLLLGRWRECAQRLREGARGGPQPGERP
jgi:hypothetical protein